MNVIKSFFSPSSKNNNSSKNINNSVSNNRNDSEYTTPRRPSLSTRSSKMGPRLSASSLALAGIKDDKTTSNDDDTFVTSRFSNMKRNPLNYKNNNNDNNNSNSGEVDINEIKVTVKSVSKKSNTPSVNNNNNNDIVLKEVSIAPGSAGSELIGLRISVYNPRTQNWLDGIVVSFNADRHRICFDDTSTEDYFLPTVRIKLEEVGANMIAQGKLRRTSVLKVNNIETKSTNVVNSSEMSSIKRLIESRKSINISLDNIASTVNDIDINDNTSIPSASVRRGSVRLSNESKGNKNDTAIPLTTITPFSNDTNDQEPLSSYIPFSQSTITELSPNLPPPPPLSAMETTEATVLLSSSLSSSSISSCKPKEYLFSLEVNTKKGKELIYYCDGQDPDVVAREFVERKGLPKKLIQALSIAIREKHLESLKWTLTSTKQAAEIVNIVPEQPEVAKEEVEIVKEIYKEVEVIKEEVEVIKEEVEVIKEEVEVIKEEVEVIKEEVEVIKEEVEVHIDDTTDILGDWVETADENGNKYYYNSVTGQTSWQNPSAESNNDWVETADENDNKYYYNSVTGQTSWQNPSTEIYNDWIETADENGNKYYYNSVTGQTSWQNPSTEIYNNDWIETADENGNKYYYNSVTGQTSWQNPNAESNNELGA